jgi:glycosyltransferase involved in cell wall biosynthesis
MLRVAAVVLHTLRHALADRLRATWRSATRRERKLRIGVDIRPFYEPLTGIGWYLYFLLHEFAKHEDVELHLFGDARVTDLGLKLHADIPANAKLHAFDLRGVPYTRMARAITAAAYVALIKVVDPDVMFAANFFLPRLHGSVARRRVIVMHDLTYKRFPELVQKETLDNLEALMPREVALADAIVCVSESTRRDLLEFYPVDPSRAIAIHSGMQMRSDGAPIDDLPQRYLLFVSTIEPRKNLGTLLDAFARLRREGYAGSLVVVGRVGWKAREVERRLREPGVVHLDYVDAARLATVYRKAEVFVFPSLYEGFGFPLLEAMASGVPAVAARSSSLPEIGGDAALYFEPRDVDGLVAQLRRVIDEPALREELIAKGRDRVAHFRWDVCAEKTLEVLRRVS